MQFISHVEVKFQSIWPSDLHGSMRPMSNSDRFIFRVLHTAVTQANGAHKTHRTRNETKKLEAAGDVSEALLKIY